MENVKKNVPVLRFGEFVGDWEVKTLIELFNFKNGVNASKEQYGTGYKFINVLDIINNNFITHDIIQGSVDIPKEMFLKNEVKYGDILFQRSSETREEVGQASVYLDEEKNATFGGFVIRGQGIAPYHPVFMNFLLKTSAARKEIVTKSGGSTRFNVGQDILSKVKINLPTLPEQQKIANFLTAIDTKIQQLRQKQTLLEQYKKGVMQQIFKQEIRFKKADGGEFEDWEEKRLGEVGVYYNGLTGKTKENFGSGKPFIKYKQIFDNSRIDLTKCDFVEIFENDNQQKAKYGDIFFTTSSETPNEIGFASVLLDEVEELYLNSFSFGFRPKSFQILVPKFAQFLFHSNLVRKKIIKLAQGSTRYNMSKVQLMKIKISFPCEAEQQKIATFLSSIDKRIASVTAQVEEMEGFKKGLLQGMFV